MDKAQFLNDLSEVIVNNSNIGADPDDEVMFENVEDVMLNISPADSDVTVLFEDGTEAKITVEIADGGND